MNALMKKYVNENWRGLALKLGVMFGLMIIAALLVSWGNSYYYTERHSQLVIGFSDYTYHDEGAEVFFVIMNVALYVFGTVASSLAFGNLGDKQHRLSEITFPATQSEKYFVRWLIFVPVFLILFAVTAFAAESVRYLFSSAIAEVTSMVRFCDFGTFVMREASDGSEVVDNGYVVSVLFFFVLQSAFFLGSILWHKAPYVKTFLALGLLLLFYFIVCYATVWLFNGFDNQIVEGSDDGVMICVYSLTAVIVIFNYWLSYVRFKEMDVIDHW